MGRRRVRRRPRFFTGPRAAASEQRQDDRSAHGRPPSISRHLASADVEERSYWLGALLREANTRDVWLFVTPDEIRAAWTDVLRHLGRRRDMWGYLLQLDASWPPLPEMLLPLSTDELREYRDELAERLRRLATP